MLRKSKSRFLSGEKMLCLIFVGSFALLNAQGITNTLGGNTANDKFIVENSNSDSGLAVTGEGKVGIGTTEPHAKLHVISTTMNGADNTAKFEALGIGSNASHIHYGTKGDWYIRSATADGKIIIQDSGGNVGIGTTNPTCKLDVDGGAGVAIYGNSTSDFGIYGISPSHHHAGVYGESDEGSGVWGLHTNSTYSASGVLGQNTGLGSGVFGYATGTNGKGVVGHGKSYDFDAVGPGIDYGATSSIRWKKNIIEIDNPLEKLAELRGVYFDWDEEHGGRHDVGCIAEEVGKVLPEIVVYEENGIDADGMDYSKLTPLLIEVAKAQQKLIEDLTERINFLESK